MSDFIKKIVLLVMGVVMVASVYARPKFETGENWDKMEFVIPDIKKTCLFFVPNLISGFGSGINISYEVSDEDEYVYYGEVNIKDTEELAKLGYKIQQYPEAGEEIMASQSIMLVVSDADGNADTISKWCHVQGKKEIIHIEMRDTAVCAEAYSSMRSFYNAGGSYYRTKYGEVVVSPSFCTASYYYNPNRVSGADDFMSSDTTELLFDESCYSCYSDKEYFDKWLATLEEQFNSASNSGTYLIIVQDSALGCKDTAMAYIQVNEAPRVVFTADTVEAYLGDTLPYDMIKWRDVCTASLTPIIEDGWLVNGEKYDRGNLDKKANRATLTYYATNECGTTVSDLSLYAECTDDVNMDMYHEWGCDTISGSAVLKIIGADDDAVINIPADGLIISEEYYNMSGQKIAEPIEGINIVKRKREDGSVEWVKAIGR